MGDMKMNIVDRFWLKAALVPKSFVKKWLVTAQINDSFKETIALTEEAIHKAADEKGMRAAPYLAEKMFQNLSPATVKNYFSHDPNPEVSREVETLLENIQRYASRASETIGTTRNLAIGMPMLIGGIVALNPYLTGAGIWFSIHGIAGSRQVAKSAEEGPSYRTLHWKIDNSLNTIRRIAAQRLADTPSAQKEREALLQERLALAQQKGLTV